MSNECQFSSLEGIRDRSVADASYQEPKCNAVLSVSLAYPYVRGFDRSHSVVAGQSLEIECRAWGWRTPNVSWYRGHQELTPITDPRVSLSSARERPAGSLLTIDGVEQSDRAYYTCVAWSDDWGVTVRHNATVLVRVKGPNIRPRFYVD